MWAEYEKHFPPKEMLNDLDGLWGIQTKETVKAQQMFYPKTYTPDDIIT